ncbi:MAG: hypothetical protein ACO4CU_01295 [Ilumatobacteraceae bacterium]
MEELAFRIDRGPTRSVDVVVSVDAEHTVEELTAAVAAFVGVAGPVRLVRRDGERDVGLDAAATDSPVRAVTYSVVTPRPRSTSTIRRCRADTRF